MNLKDVLSRFHGIEANLPDHYGDWLGYDIVNFEKDTGKILTVLDVRDDHLSPSGAVHGGVISGFLDFSCGCAVFSVIEKGQLCSTVELNVKYFRPLRSGDQLQAEAQVIHRGKSLCSVLATAYRGDEREKPVALATGIFNSYPASKVAGR